MVTIVICFLTRKIDKFKTNKKNVHVPNQFCLVSISSKINIKAKEVSLEVNAYDFSVNYDAIDKSDKLNMHKHLMVKNDI